MIAKEVSEDNEGRWKSSCVCLRFHEMFDLRGRLNTQSIWSTPRLRKHIVNRLVYLRHSCSVLQANPALLTRVHSWL